jgi:hypothetical protein
MYNQGINLKFISIDYKLLVNEPVKAYKCDIYMYPYVKGKVIPLHAMEAHGVRGGRAPTHS